MTPRRILLIKPSSMGDVIHSLPVVAALHKHWPDAEIRWLIHPAFCELVENNPAVSGTVVFPRDQFRGLIGLGRALLWARKLREWKPDLVIDLQGLLRSALMARCTGARTIVGLSDAREGAGFFYSAKAKVNSKMHAVDRYLCVLDLLGVSRRSVDFFLPKGKLPTSFLINRPLSKLAAADAGQGILGAQKSEHIDICEASSTGVTKTCAAEGEFRMMSEPFVVLHPYARGEGKNLNSEQIKAFASALGEVPVVIVGRGEKFSDLPSNVIDWSGRTTILELIEILRQAAFIVSSDSGPMHLATALQPSKTLAIHRWSDPLRVGPWSKESLVWKNGMIARVDELTENFRAPGKTPTLDEMREIGRRVKTEFF